MSDFIFVGRKYSNRISFTRGNPMRLYYTQCHSVYKQGIWEAEHSGEKKLFEPYFEDCFQFSQTSSWSLLQLIKMCFHSDCCHSATIEVSHTLGPSSTVTCSTELSYLKYILRTSLEARCQLLCSQQLKDRWPPSGVSWSSIGNA